MRLILPTFFLVVTALTTPALAADSAAQQQFVFAYRLMQNHDDKLAAEAFDQFVKDYPDDARRGDAVYYRALLARRGGDNAAAAKLLDTITTVSLIPPHTLAILRGQVYDDLGRYNDAAAALDKVKLDDLDATTRASIYYLRGLAYRGAKNFAGAQTQFIGAANMDSPMKPRAMLELGKTQAAAGATADAIKTLAGVLDLKDTDVSPEAARAAGDLLSNNGEFVRAVAMYQHVTTDYPSSPQFGPAAVGILWSQLTGKDYDALLKSFDQFQGSLKGEDKVTAFYLAGSAEQEKGRHERAAAFFQSILSSVNSSPLLDKVMFKLAASQLELGKFSEMAATLTKLAKSYPDSPQNVDGQLLLAAADLKQNDPRSAESRLNKIVDKGAETPGFGQALLERAKLYVQTNQLDAAAKDYQSYVALAADAKSVTRGVTPLSVHQATIRLADVLYRSNRGSEADSQLASLLAVEKLEPGIEQDGLFQRTLVQIKLGRVEDALSTIDQLITKYPTTSYLPEARYYRGLLLMASKKPDDAVPDLEAAGDSTALAEPLRISALRLLASRYREKGDPTSAAAALSKIEKFAGQDKVPDVDLLWLGEYYIDKGEPKAGLLYVLPVYKKIEAGSNLPRGVAAQVYFQAARGFRAMGQLDGAADGFKKAADKADKSDMKERSLLELARTFEQQSKLDAALEQLKPLSGSDVSRIAADSLYETAVIQRKVAAKLRLGSDVTGATAALKEAQKSLKRITLLYAFPELSPMPEQSYVELAEVSDELGDAEGKAAALGDLVEKYKTSPYGKYARAMLRSTEPGGGGDAVYQLTKLKEDEKSLDPRLASRVAAAIKALNQE